MRSFSIKNFYGSISMLKFMIDERTTYFLNNVEMFKYVKKIIKKSDLQKICLIMQH